MFVIASYFDGEKSIINETIETITKFHPNEKVVIVDSDSPTKDYANDLISDKVEFFDAKNRRRPIGALLEAYKKYPNESYYVLMHDTSALTSSIQKFIDQDSEIISFIQCPSPLGTIPSHIWNQTYFNWIRNAFQTMDYEVGENFETDETYSCIVGCMGIYKNSIIKKFIDKGIDESFNSYSFEEFQWAERAVGYLAKLEGIDVRQNTIEGDSFSVWYNLPTGNLPYLKKICAGR